MVGVLQTTPCALLASASWRSPGHHGAARIRNSNAIVPMTTVASAGAYLLSTPVELGPTYVSTLQSRPCLRRGTRRVIVAPLLAQLSCHLLFPLCAALPMTRLGSAIAPSRLLTDG